MHMMQVSSEVHMAEIYSPPRVTTEGQKWGLSTGEAMDLTTGWDFRLKEHRDKAWECPASQAQAGDRKSDVHDV